jgi:hypothetical protein
MVLGCSSEADTESAGADLSNDANTSAPCPATDPATRAALGNIAEVAETCPDVAPPDPGELRPFKHDKSIAGSLLPSLHRGRDAFYPVGAPQWVLGKFSYGEAVDLTDEDVDIFVLRGCGGTWEKLGTTTTTTILEHDTVEGVVDDGARVFFQIPDAKKLDVGRHRVRMVVAGDHTVAEQFIEVLPPGTPLLVSDVDGTLTENQPGSSVVCDEESDFPALARMLVGEPDEPKLHEGVSKLYRSIVSAGYRPMYLTARPEFLVPHTRKFLREKNRSDGRGDLPQGLVHTTITLTGAFNAAAQAFKTDELKRLVAKGFDVRFGFGNRPSDVAAYDANHVTFRYYFENLDTVWRACTAVEQVTLLPSPYPAFTDGDFRIKDYADLDLASASLPPVCPKP